MARKRYIAMQSELAEFHGVTPQTVSYWVTKKKMTGFVPGKGWDTQETTRWVNDPANEVGANQRNGTGRAAATGDIRERKMLAEISKLRQEVRFKRLKNDQLEARLIDYDDVCQWVASNLLRIKQRLESIPNEMQVLAPSEARGTFRASMESYVFELLTEMSGWRYDRASETVEGDEEGEFE